MTVNRLWGTMNVDLKEDYDPRYGVHRTMRLTHISAAAVVIASLPSWSLYAQSTGEKPSRATKQDLTPKSFEKLYSLIRPHDNEWRHLKVQWQTDVVAARKKAAAEDKPIIICYTGGAGYNEPLGVC